LIRFLNLVLTLALLFGIAYLSVTVYGGDAPEDRLTVLMGFVLLAATVAGGMAKVVGLPKITGFLVVGILAGPSVMGLIPWGALDELRLIDQFALALIALLAGGELKVNALRPAARSIALTTLAVVGVVWIGVTLVFVPIGFFLPFLDGAGFLGILALGALLGIWSANSSPDLTVAVIEETRSKGPLTDVILGVTIVKDVVVIVLFTLMLALAQPLLGHEVGEGGLFAELLWEVGGALAVGGVLGWVFSLYLEKEGEQPAYALFLFAYVLVLAAELLHIELLLAGVAAGFVIENLSEAGDEMIRGIEKVSVVIFAFFFTIAGASLDLGAIGGFWLAAIVLFSARLGLTYYGAKLGTRWAEAQDEIQTLTWRGLMSQGGVTLGLLLVLQEAFPEIGEGVMALGMAVIIGNILGGPVLLKTALAGAGAGTEAGMAQEDRDEEVRADFGALVRSGTGPGVPVRSRTVKAAEAGAGAPEAPAAGVASEGGVAPEGEVDSGDEAASNGDAP
jgi:Kef-type K+ transport system membrane component KefB